MLANDRAKFGKHDEVITLSRLSCGVCRPVLPAKLKVCCIFWCFSQSGTSYSCYPSSAVSFASPVLPGKLKVLCTVLWKAKSTIRLLRIDRHTLPGLSLSISTLVSTILSYFFSLSFISKFSYLLQSSASLFGISTFQRLGSVLSYPSSCFLLHFFFSLSSHQNSLTLRTLPRKMWRFFFACLRCLDTCQEEGEANYRMTMSITTFLSRFITTIETLDGAASQSVA